MEYIYDLGIQIILFLQSLGSWFVGPMQFFSFLGKEEFFLFIAPALVWCLDARLGLRTGLALMVSGSVNHFFKLAFAGARPYWYSEQVLPLSTEFSFGAPSGHAQNATVVWGVIANGLRRRWVTILMVIVIFLIGISRLFLGMHFPHDVLLGWAIGAVLLWLILRFERPVLAWLGRYRLLEQIIIAFGASLALIAAGGLVRIWLGNWTMPETWAILAARAEPPRPLELSSLFANAGVFFGLAAGAILLRHAGWYDAHGPVTQLILRFIIGVIGVAILWYGLGKIFPRGEDALPFLLRYLRYALVGLWIIYIAPTLFIRLGLAKRPSALP